VENIFASDYDGVVIYGDSYQFISQFPPECFSLIYLDPPFNTGGLAHYRDQEADYEDRKSGRRYPVRRKSLLLEDFFQEYFDFMKPHLRQAYRLLSTEGTLYVHLDYHQVHYIKVFLDTIFERKNFLNEIVWAYDFGTRSRDRWPKKHQTILVYAKQLGRHIFNWQEIMELLSTTTSFTLRGRRFRDKLPSDVWWYPIATTGERLGYPNQKPISILRRVIAASSRPNDWVLDFFAGSGTTGAAAAELGRRFILIDNNPAAIVCMHQRFADLHVGYFQA